MDAMGGDLLPLDDHAFLLSSLVFLPRSWVRSLLANAFLLNIQGVAQPSLEGQESTFGRHSWERLYGQAGCLVSVHKVACLLAYLHFAWEEEKGRHLAAGEKNEGGDPYGGLPSPRLR